MPKSFVPIAPRIIAAVAAESRSPTILQEPQSSPFSGEAEYRYFRFFHEKTAERLSGFFNEALWNRLVLQACEYEPSIRHAVIAIGALDMALEHAQGTKRPEYLELGDEDKKVVSHHQFALQQYGKAIKRMQDNLSKPRQDMRTILIACLLFVCFETFHGNNNSAVKQAQSGIKMINGWLPQFVKQGNLPADHIPGLRSPAPYVIEDELVHAFSRLDVLALSFAEEQPLDIAPQLSPNIREFSRLMPQTFLSVEEARMYWDLMWGQTLRYVAKVHGWGAILGLEESDRMRPGEHWDKSFPDIRQDTEERQEDHLEASLRWESAFEALFQGSQCHPTQKDSAAAMILTMQNKACYTAMSCGFTGSEMYSDSQLPVFLDILRLAEIVISQIKKRESANRAIFSFDGPISGSIYIVASMCRERHTRRRAISMLESTPRREGIWDSILMANIAKTAMEIEERGLEGEFIPEKARIKVAKTSFNMQKRRGTMWYLRVQPEELGREQVLPAVEEAGFSW